MKIYMLRNCAKNGMIFLLFCLGLAVFPLHANAAQTDQKAKIYALSSAYSEKISIPDDLPLSYQIPEGGKEGAEYSVIDGYSAKVSADGLVTTNYTYKKGDQVVTENDDYDTRKFESGDTQIEVKTADGTYRLIVTVEDYAVTYGEEVMDDYLEKNITDAMTDREILDVIAKFPASYDYGTHPSLYTMIIFGDGSCSASTRAITRLCEKLGIQAWVRNGNKDPGASYGHVDAMAELNGIYYEIEAGFDEPKGPQGYRSYFIKQRSSLFSCYSNSDGLSIYQYDGYDDTGALEVPEAINGRTVTGIERQAFYDKKFSEIKLPDTLKEIGDYAFHYCDKLTSISIPASVTSIGKAVFSECAKLEHISIADDNASYMAQDEVIYSKDGSALVACPFADAPLVPSAVTKIEDYAFYNNENLTRIVIPESVTELGESAFEDCGSLSSVTFEGEGLEKIGASCFCKTDPYVLRIPASVTSVGAFAFARCGNMKYIYFSGDAPTFGSIADGEFQDQVFEDSFNQNLHAYYVHGNDTWTQDVLTDHGGISVTWSAWEGRTESLEGAAVTLEQGSYKYTGKEITPAVFLALAGRTLEENRDYIVRYFDNKAVGTATVMVTGIGACEGEIRASFLINKGDPYVAAYLFSDEILENDATEVVHGDYFDYTFVSSDPSVATVDGEGRVRGVSAGTAEITVRQAETENHLAGVKSMEITVIHNQVTGTEVIDGRVEIKCDRCGNLFTHKTVPTRFAAYWGAEFKDYDDKSFRKAYQAGEVLECRTSDTSEAELFEMEVVSLDDRVVRITDYCFLNFIADGVAKVIVRPKYNPAIGRTFTFYVGNAVDPGDGNPGGDNPGGDNPGSGDSGSDNPGSGGSGSDNPGDGSGSDNPGSGDSGSGNPGSGDSGSGNPGNGDSGSGNPGSGNPGNGDSGNHNSENGGLGNGGQSDGSKIKYYDKQTGITITISNSQKKEAVLTGADQKHAKGKLTIPDTLNVNGTAYKLTAIGKNAFKNQKQLKTVVIGKNIKTIGENAFYGCGKLQTATLGKNLTAIGNKAFYKCIKLKKITIPSKVSKIGKSAFYGCKNLKNITIQSKKLTNKNVGSKAFKGICSSSTIRVPKSKFSAYKKMLKSKGAGKKMKVKK